MQDLLHLSYNRYTCFEYQDFTDLSSNSIFGDSIFGDRNSDIYPFYKKNGVWTQIKTFNDEETFVKNYGNPLFTIFHHRITIVVCKDENKVSLKIFSYYRERKKGKQFFKIAKDVKFLTFNYKKFALYTGGINNYHLKKKAVKSLKRSNGSGNLINNFRRRLSYILSTESKEDLIEKNNIINRVINTFLLAIPGIENYNNLNDDLKLCKYMYDRKGIKLPNNWNVLYSLYPQPTKKQYSKCDNKYIDAFMLVNNVSGDKLRRVLHKVNNCNINNFIVASKIFGKDFILSQPDDLLKTILESNQTINGSWGEDIHTILSKKEKNNAFEIFKLALIHKIQLNSLNDHFRLYRNLKPFEVVKWKSFDKKTFNNEHFDYSERYGFYTKGEFTRIYSLDKITKTQEIILSKNEPIYPVVLLTSKEYNIESKIQSNCVKGYVDRASSLIISLRKGDVESEERATIEYHFKKIFDNVYLKRAQSLGRFNSTLLEEWGSSLQILDERVQEIWGGKNFEFPEVEVKLAHKTIQTKSEFKNEINIFHGIGEFLEWKEKIVNDIKSLDVQNNDFLLNFEF